MAQIISSNQNQVNKNFSETTNGRRVTTRFTRQYLSNEQFQKTHEKKRKWLKAAIQACGLRGNEIPVAEVIIFSTDPITGIGCPSLSYIRQQLIDTSKGALHYQTVSRIVGRLRRKGAFRIDRRYNNSNIYTMNGYAETKLPMQLSDSLTCLNIPSLNYCNNTEIYRRTHPPNLFIKEENTEKPLGLDENEAQKPNDMTTNSTSCSTGGLVAGMTDKQRIAALKALIKNGEKHAE
jgi:hypothetical protein